MFFLARWIVWQTTKSDRSFWDLIISRMYFGSTSFVDRSVKTESEVPKIEKCLEHNLNRFNPSSHEMKATFFPSCRFQPSKLATLWRIEASVYVAGKKNRSRSSETSVDAHTVFCLALHSPTIRLTIWARCHIFERYSTPVWMSCNRSPSPGKWPSSLILQRLCGAKKIEKLACMCC